LTGSESSGLTSLSFLLVKNYPKAWQEFWDPIHSLSHSLGVDVNGALEVFKLVYESVSKEEEGRPVSTGFLVGDSERLKGRLPDSAKMTIARESLFNAAKTIRSMFGLVDGYASLFIVGKDGMLEDARLMPNIPTVPDESTFVSGEFCGYSGALRGAPGFGLIALGSLKTAKLFFDGGLRDEVYFSGKAGEWAHRSLIEVRKKLDQIALEKDIAPRVLYKIFSTAIRMSNHRKGGTMIVGNPEQVLGQSEPPRFRIGGINVLDLRGVRERHLFNLATQEFALLISPEGELKASSVRLLARLPEAVKLELSAADGGRHRSAAEISASADCVAFVVSDDGPITVFVEGKRALRV